jgi:hypothetical protein
LLLALGCRFQGPSSSAFVLIRNAQNPTAALSTREARDLLLGRKKTWAGGKVLVLVLNPAGSPELRWLAGSLAGVSDAALMTRIRQQVFEGEMRKPIASHNDQETLAAVAAEPGALGVLSAETARHLPPEVLPLPLQ